MNNKKLSLYFEAYDKLKKIAKTLHKLDEASCNYGLTQRQEKRVKKLEKQAEEIAKKVFNLHAYHQGDPRGATLYLVEDKNDYHNGVCIL